MVYLARAEITFLKSLCRLFDFYMKMINQTTIRCTHKTVHVVYISYTIASFTSSSVVHEVTSCSTSPSTAVEL